MYITGFRHEVDVAKKMVVEKAGGRPFTMSSSAAEELEDPALAVAPPDYDTSPVPSMEESENESDQSPSSSSSSPMPMPTSTAPVSPHVEKFKLDMLVPERMPPEVLDTNFATTLRDTWSSWANIWEDTLPVSATVPCRILRISAPTYEGLCRTALAVISRLSLFKGLSLCVYMLCSFT